MLNENLVDEYCLYKNKAQQILSKIMTNAYSFRYKSILKIYNKRNSCLSQSVSEKLCINVDDK